MAGDWTKIEHALPDKPEVIAMSLRLSIEVDLVVGKLLRLWRWVDVHADIRANLDGHVHGVDNGWIDAHVRQDGFADALRFVKWLRNKRGGIIFPKIGKHLGEGAKARAGEAVRKRMQRGKCPEVCPDKRPDQRREEKRGGSLQSSRLSSKTSAIAPLRLVAATRNDRGRSRDGDRDKPKRAKNLEYSEDFQRAWKAYGRKGSTKGDAVKPFEAAVKIITARDDAPADPTEWLIERTGTFATLHDVVKDKKYRKDYVRWLKGKGYDFDDEVLRETQSSSPQLSLAERMKHLEVTRD